jgi:hypothetical protein
LYGYANNNPISWIDPSGTDPRSSQQKAKQSAGKKASASAANSYWTYTTKNTPGVPLADITRFNELLAAAYYVGDPKLDPASNHRSDGVPPLIRGAIEGLIKEIRAEHGEPEPLRLKALWWAIDHLGDTEYGPNKVLGNGSHFSGGVFNQASKCNLFVADSWGHVVGFSYCGIPELGHGPGVQLLGNPLSPHPASANWLGNKTANDPNFNKFVKKPLPGDIAGFAEPHSKPNDPNSGHSTIVVGNGVLIYASGTEVKLGDLNYVQKGHDPVVYREYNYVDTSEEDQWPLGGHFPIPT